MALCTVQLSDFVADRVAIAELRGCLDPDFRDRDQGEPERDDVRGKVIDELRIGEAGDDWKTSVGADANCKRVAKTHRFRRDHATEP